MGQAKTNDGGKGESIALSSAFKVTIFAYGHKTTIEGDCDLKAIRSLLQNFLANGCQWKTISWLDPPTPGGKKIKKEEAALNPVKLD